MSTQNPVFIPGPTNMPERLRRAIDYPSVDHRSPEFVEMLEPAIAGVKRILKTTKGEAVLFPSTGTGAWEAAISNTLSAGDKVLAAEYGMFTHRWIDMCQKHGLNVQIVDTPWGEGVPAGEYERILRADSGHEIKVVLVCHNETTTGVRSDIAAVRKAIDAAGHPALLFVDGVSSIASMDFRMDEWGVDMAITGSQKGFMLPPGLAILGVSPKALAAMKGAKLPRCFFDIPDMLARNKSGGFPYTPPVSLIRGLSAAIEMIEDEGLEQVFARHHRIAEGIRRAIAAWGLKLSAAHRGLYSDTVSTILVPEGKDANAFVALAATKYGVAFGTGLGHLAGKAFRIGHLGSMTDVMALSGIATAEMVMADLDFPVSLGSGVGAAQEYYRKSAAQAGANVSRRAA